MLTERLDNREDNLTRGRINRIVLDEVEEAVGIALLIGVDAVEIHHLQKRLVVETGHGQIVYLCAGGVGEIFDVELELRLLNLVSANIIHVLHHQVPHREIGRRSGALEHLQIQRLVGGGDVARELADLKDLAIVRIFVGHGEDFVGVQRALERYIAQRGVEGVLARRKQTGTLDFLEIAAARYAIGAQRLEHLGDLADVARSGIFGLDDLKKVIRGIGRIGECGIRRPVVRRENLVFAEIHESDEVARLLVLARLVGDPHLYTRDAHARRDIREARGEAVVVVAEKLRQEVVAVLVVLVGIDGELRGLRAAAGVDGLGLGVLLRHKRRGGQAAELQLGLDTEERR